MIVRAVEKIDGHRSFVFGHGYSDYKTKNYEVAQDIESALLEFQNDCFFALNHGINWFERLGYKNQKEALDNDIYNIVSNRYGVLNIQSFESDVRDREYNCNIGLYTIFSDDIQYIEFNKKV